MNEESHAESIVDAIIKIVATTVAAVVGALVQRRFKPVKLPRRKRRARR